MKNRIMDNYVKRFCIVLRTKELFLKGKVCDNNENIVLYK